MTTLTDYPSIVENIKAVIEDDGVEFASFIPTAIALAEKRLRDELDLPDLERKFIGSMVQGTNTISKPLDYSAPHYLQITRDDGTRKLLKHHTDDFLVEYWPNPSVEEEPKYYSNESDTLFVVAPTPDSNYTYTLRYDQIPAQLTDVNTVNYFTERCVDILFFACLVEVTKFTKAWSQVDRWERDYVRARDVWNISASKQRRDDGSQPNNPEGGQNTLKHNVMNNSSA